MNDKNKHLIIWGAVCVILLAGSVVYSIIFNHGGLIFLTDVSDYSFTAKDLPLVIAVFFLVAYIIFLFRALTWIRKTKTTRKINPKLGLLGILGLLGFSGIFTYSLDGTFFPFVFFSFWGFAGFFFEGKMGGTMRDEMFEQNRLKAKANSNQIALLLVVFALIVSAGMANMEIAFLFLFITISLVFGLAVFLNEYLVYCYERQE